jgi:hypothetical protein
MNRPAFLLAAGFLLASMLTTSAPAAATSDADRTPVRTSLQADVIDDALATVNALADGALNVTDRPLPDPCAAIDANGVEANPCCYGPGTAFVCCGEFIVSELGGSTRWTDPFPGPGAWGYNKNPVQLAATSIIPGAASLWKENPGVGEGNATSEGVEFVAAWVACEGFTSPSASIRVLSDNANRVFVNNSPVGQCGTWGQHSNCFSSAQGYVVPILPYPQANTIRIHVMNAAGNNWATNPAQVAYRVDF